VASLTRCVDERRVDGVAVMRHAVLVVPAVLVGAIDVDREFDGPAVTVEFRGEVVLDGPAPALVEFFLNRLAPLHDRCDVCEVVGVQQRETLPVVELAVEVDGLGLAVKAFENAKELGEDITGGVAVFETRTARV